MRWLLLVALAMATSAEADPSDGVAAEARGQSLAVRNCAMCHSIGRAGASLNPAAPPFRDLGARYDIDGLAAALADGIIRGHPAMPEFRFSPAEVNDLIHYLRAIQSREAASKACRATKAASAHARVTRQSPCGEQRPEG